MRNKGTCHPRKARYAPHCMYARTRVRQNMLLQSALKPCCRSQSERAATSTRWGMPAHDPMTARFWSVWRSRSRACVYLSGRRDAALHMPQRRSTLRQRAAISSAEHLIALREHGEKPRDLRVHLLVKRRSVTAPALLVERDFLVAGLLLRFLGLRRICGIRKSAPERRKQGCDRCDARSD